MAKAILLSSPHMSDEGYELEYIHDAFNKNWIAPLGENVNEFEKTMGGYIGTGHPVALSAGTAALHLSMILAFSTMYPESQFLVFFIIPVKAWVLALVDLILIAVDVFNMCYPVMLFPHCLFPLIGLLNYFLFFWPDMGNLLPLSWRVKLRRKRHSQNARPKVVPFNPPVRQESASTSVPYTHRCTVCGRTDVSHPELEFRYCSRCEGYHCYCEEHISNHTHIQ
jgi:hypothetical protein